MEPEDNLDSLVKDHNARLAPGRQSMQEVPNEFGKASVQLVEDRGLIYKTRYHAIFYNQFGYILEFVATPGTYDTNLPKFMDFTRKVEFLSSSGQWEKPKPLTLLGKIP